MPDPAPQSPSWRGYPDLKRIRQERDILNDPVYQEQRGRFVGHVRDVQAARSWGDFFGVHRRLFVEYAARQTAERQVIPPTQAQVSADIAAASQVRPLPLDRLQELEGRKQRAQHVDSVSRALKLTTRTVADAIAWRALGYDRAAIAVLGRGTRVDSLAQGVGLDAEIEVLRRLWEEQGVFAIHNDLTSCLRHGDLTAIRGFGIQRQIDIYEVKAGKATKRNQVQRMKDAIELLSVGSHPTAGKGQPLTIVRLVVRYRTFMSNLRDLVAQARRRGHAWSSPSLAMVVSAVDYRRCAGREESYLVPAIEAMHKAVGWRDNGDDVLSVTYSQRRIRDVGDSGAYLAPVTILPFSADDVVDLAMGWIDVAVFLNCRVLQAMFAAKGIRAQFNFPPSPASFLRAEFGANVVTVPSSMREQMLLELVTPASLIRSIRPPVGTPSPSAAKGLSLVVFADEERVWGRS